ncbi:FAD-binding oxidoreductase [Streptomyces sp. NPDC047028]|uniref:FAD-binding oxidoreductase n=1 Tax=Streptomyces sp. NPDC047028 TaxID=3155793 RepID=UPI0033F41072
MSDPTQMLTGWDRTGSRLEELTGWGHTAPSTARVAEPVTRAAVQALLAAARPGGVIARGAGRSYGDPAQNAGGHVIRCTQLARIHDLNSVKGLIRVDAGATLASLQQQLLPLGFSLPVLPGTAHITVGGAIAADVHGKNHPTHGSFGDHVLGLTLYTPTGEHQLAPDREPEAFWATIGGMGLTGIITTATVRAQPIPSPFIAQHTQRCRDLEALVKNLDASAHQHNAAWIDCFTTGRRLGRSLLTSGDWAAPGYDTIARPTPPPPRPRPLPSHVPTGLLRPATVRVFNTAKYHRTPQNSHTQVLHSDRFFHPLDAVTDWNRLYGSGGLTQYQCTIPHTRAITFLRRMLETLHLLDCPPYLAVLKRLGTSTHSYLSFPRPGYTLALDFPANHPQLPTALMHLDALTLDNGGRLYLAKDSRTNPNTILSMYPELDAWRLVRDRLDPHRIFTSDQARRLHLLAPTRR